VNGTVRLVDSVSDAFTGLVADGILASPDGFRLFASGGGTAEACYRALAARNGLDWSGVDVYMGDERCVPPDDPDSNHRMIASILLDAVGPVRGDHPMYTGGPPGDAASAYQEFLATLPDFGLVHLGLGPDGHTASLFPGSAALEITDPARSVVANIDPNGVNPHERITLTYGGIARAGLVVFTVEGASKRDAFNRIAAGEDLPAGRVHGHDVLWLVDSDAIGTVTPDEVG